MKNFFSLLAAVCIITTSFAQKTIHDPNAEVRSVSGFHAIEVSGGIDLYLSNGNEAVAISASDKEVRDHIKTEVKDGVLKIYYEWKKGVKFSIKGNKSMKAYVSFKNLDKLSASGGSDVGVDGTIKSNTLNLDLSGGSDFNGKVDVTNLKVDQSGGSDVNISGTAGSIKIDASGGSDFSGYELVSDVCIINASGGSDIDITVNKELDAEASGASDISWKGSATVKKARASGSGSVSHRS
jgi:hypothetical protein